MQHCQRMILLLQVERVSPANTDPLSFAILKAKMNVDECSRLRFLNELQSQEVRRSTNTVWSVYAPHNLRLS